MRSNNAVQFPADFISLRGRIYNFLAAKANIVISPRVGLGVGCTGADEVCGWKRHSLDSLITNREVLMPGAPFIRPSMKYVKNFMNAKHWSAPCKLAELESQ